MRTARLIVFGLGLAVALVGAVGLAGGAAIPHNQAVTLLAAGFTLAVLGSFLDIKIRGAVRFHVDRVGGTGGGGFHIHTTVRSERIVGRELNGQSSVEISGDPLAAKDPHVQRRILDELRQSGKLSDDAINVIAKKLQHGP